VDDQRLGALLRAVRIRRRLRQEDVAAGAGVDRSWVSRIERGHLRDVSIGRLRAIARVLEVGLEIVPSWRGGEVARVVNERHSRLHELFAAHLARTPSWEFATEVSFSSWGERGVIDILAWHAVRRVLLVIELKTEIPDPANLIAQVDRYRRLAPGIGRGRGWDATSVATWVLLAESDMNRRQLARHRVMLRNAFPLDGRTLRRWLRDPGSAGAGVGVVNGLAFLANAGPDITNPRLGPTKRVRARTILANASPATQLRGNRGLQSRSGAVRASPGTRDPG
jgi:transcriptional regulator with XRE-family HTH domain